MAQLLDLFAKMSLDQFSEVIDQSLATESMHLKEMLMAYIEKLLAHTGKLEQRVSALEAQVRDGSGKRREFHFYKHEPGDPSAPENTIHLVAHK
jgi:hypothetical protein